MAELDIEPREFGSPLIKRHSPGPRGQRGKAIVSVPAVTSKAAGTEGPAPPSPGLGGARKGPWPPASHLPLSALGR